MDVCGGGEREGGMKGFTNVLENFLRGKSRAWHCTDHLLQIAGVANEGHPSPGFFRARTLNPDGRDGRPT